MWDRSGFVLHEIHRDSEALKVWFESINEAGAFEVPTDAPE